MQIGTYGKCFEIVADGRQLCVLDTLEAAERFVACPVCSACECIIQVNIGEPVKQGENREPLCIDCYLESRADEDEDEPRTWADWKAEAR